MQILKEHSLIVLPIRAQEELVVRVAPGDFAFVQVLSGLSFKPGQEFQLEGSRSFIFPQPGKLKILSQAKELQYSRTGGVGGYADDDDPSGPISVLDYGAVADGETDNTLAIQAAIDALAAVGGGDLNFPVGTFATGPLVIQNSRIRLVGVGASWFSGTHTERGTVFLYNGTPGGTLVTLSSVSGASNQKISDCGLLGLGLDGAGIAAKGLVVASVNRCEFDLSIAGCTDVQCEWKTVAQCVDNTSSQDNIVKYLRVWAEGSANGIKFDTDVLPGNISYNVFGHLYAHHANGYGIRLGNMDNNVFHYVRAYRTSGTGVGIILGAGDDTTRKHFRANTILLCGTGEGGLVAEGTASGVLPSENNIILAYDKDNAHPDPVIEAGAELAWRSSKNVLSNQGFVNVGFGNSVANAINALAQAVSTDFPVVIQGTGGKHIQLDNAADGKWNINVKSADDWLWITKAGTGGNFGIDLAAIPDYADDAAAAAGGILVGGFYRSGPQFRIRAASDNTEFLNVALRSRSVSVKDAPFSATGDGTTDDAAAIQAAIDYVNAAGGGVLFFPRGTYVVGATVKHKNKVLLRGEGMGRTIVAAKATLPIGDPVFAGNSGDTGLGIRLNADLGIEDITFDGAARSYPAWDTNTDPPLYGGLTAGNSRGSLVKYVSALGVRVRGCEFKNHHSIAPLNLQGCWNVLVHGNDFHDNGKDDDISPCIYVSNSFPNDTPSGNVIISDNHIHDSVRMGINFFASGGGTISGNVLENLGEGGIQLGSGANLVAITGNKFKNIVITDISASGIELNFDEATDGDVVIAGNIFEGCDGNGIVSHGQVRLVISGNILNDCGRAANFPTPAGPYMYAAGHAANDPIIDAKRAAINLGAGNQYPSQDVVIIGNTITADGATTPYALAFSATGGPTNLHERTRFVGNHVFGMALGEVSTDAVSNSGAGIYVEARQVVAPDPTPDLNCLGGNVVEFTATAASAWNAPVVLPPAGSEVTVIITQGGSGGYAITWNAAYVFPTAFSNTGNTVGKKTVVRFVSDGTKLIATGPNVWY